MRGDFRKSASKWICGNNVAYLDFLRNQVPNPAPIFETNKIPDNNSDLVFSFDDFCDAIRSKSNKVAGGNDKITYWMIKALSLESQNKLLEAMNDVFKKNYIREDWRIIRVVPIPKSNKDLSDYKNFRPISLISVFMKIINLMIKKRINEFLEEKNALPANSFAYRKNKSAPMCINQLLHEIAILKESKQNIILFNVDISDAYNHVSLTVLNELLRELGVHSAYVEWITNFLCKRKLVLEGESVEVFDGLPQGSCLSPLLFNVYTAKLHDLRDNSTSIYQFADDFLILSHMKDFNEAVENIKRKVCDFGERAISLKLSFNPEKTKIMQIKRGQPKLINVSFNNVQIPQVTSLKFLGKIISSSLSVKEHYENVIERSKNNSQLFKCLTTIKAGLHPAVSLNFYRSLVRSKIEYCRTAAAHMGVKTVNKNIESFQNSFVRRCLGLTPATPTYLFYAFANELPPAERAKLLTAREIIKIKIHNPNVYKMIQENCNLNSSYGCVYREFKDVFDKICAEIKFERFFGLTIIKNMGQNRKKDCDPMVERKKYKNAWYKYRAKGFSTFATDASVGQSSTGCGVVHIEQNKEYKFKINSVVSSTLGELYAVYLAIAIAHKKGLTKVVIFSDSLVACHLIEKNATTNFLVALIHNKLRSYGFAKCEIVWTPSHIGIDYNEQADKVAKDACVTGRAFEFSLSDSEAINIVENSIFDRWYKEVIEKDMMRNNSIFHNIFPKRKKKPWFHKVKMSAKKIKLINRLIVGCTYDAVYLKRINAITSNECICGEIESSNHLIFDCPEFEVLRGRYEIFKKFGCLKDILFGKIEENWSSLARFLNDANFVF